MSDLNYNPDKLSFNEDDQAYLSAEVDTIYKKVAEVVLAQNIRFFEEQEKQAGKICNLRLITDDHEKRILVLEKERLKKMVKKLAIAVGVVSVFAALTVIFI